MGSYGRLVQQPCKNGKSVNTNFSVLINHKTSNLKQTFIYKYFLYAFDKDDPMIPAVCTISLCIPFKYLKKLNYLLTL